MTRDLSPAAWDFLADVARRYGMSWARVLRDAMGAGFIVELDGEPVICEKPGPKVTHHQEALL